MSYEMPKGYDAWRTASPPEFEELPECQDCDLDNCDECPYLDNDNLEDWGEDED
jgi:hypothetical protein